MSYDAVMPISAWMTHWLFIGRALLVCVRKRPIKLFRSPLAVNNIMILISDAQGGVTD